MSPPTAMRPPSPASFRPPTRRIGILDAVLAVLVLAALVPVSRLYTTAPRFVERIPFENATVYDLRIDVTGADRDGWIPVTTAQSKATTVAELIIDVGEAWTFRFASQGEQGGELRLTRRELERSGWRVSIPARIGDELAAKGAPPSS